MWERRYAARIPVESTSMSSDTDQTDFGFERVHRDKKAARVRAVFDSVASRYDLMNDLMSFGVHRLWKRHLVELVGPRPGQAVLDLAGGTGDVARLLAPRIGDGRVVIADINAAMLERGRARLMDEGFAGVEFVQTDAESLPFNDGDFDAVTIAFGLRNVTDKQAVLGEMFRVLKPGGRALVLEFSKPALPGLGPVYDAYSFKVLPALGRAVTGDAGSYRYLAESIRMHPDQATLRDMMVAAGFERCDWLDVSGGIVAIHRGYKL
jgi:demethylmenaquinone methyltransferase/2-methoxy-6-polyprenyl-1,4-benzoquinol methylase